MAPAEGQFAHRPPVLVRFGPNDSRFARRRLSLRPLRSPPYRHPTGRNGARSHGSGHAGRYGRAFPRARPSSRGSAAGAARSCWAGGRRRRGAGAGGGVAQTGSVGKSSTRVITPWHRVRNVLGRRSNTSCAMASISASEGAFASVHIRTSLACVMLGRILVLLVSV